MSDMYQYTSKGYRAVEPDEPETGCPECGSEAEPEVSEGTYAGSLTCPDCGHTEHWLTPEGERAEDERIADAQAAEIDYYRREDEARRAERDQHMASDACAKDRTYYHADDRARTVVCCEAGDALQAYAGFYQPWWGEPASDPEPWPDSDDLPF